MKEIQLTQGQVTQVSDHRYDYCLQFKWQAHYNPHTQSYYAVRKEMGKTVWMHRDFMGTPKSLICDHRDRNTLNNQDDNLRNCTSQQNKSNGSLYISNTSGFKGVTKAGSKWRVRLEKDGKRVFDECLNTLEEAALAYDKAAKEHFGEFASLNFE